jgi:2-phosphosulfolactate phosphatase
MKSLEVLYTPADFAAIKRRNLDDTLCVVFDIFRATSSIVTALANGATAVIPVGEITEALAIRKRDPNVLLAGERDGLRIRAELTGGTDFDLGNSPREFTRETVAGKTIVTTTTNGTRALRACTHAKTVLIGSFLNLQATAEFVRHADPESLLLICSGTLDQAAYEDVLGAGALCDLLSRNFPSEGVSDSSLMALKLFQPVRDNLLTAAADSRNGRRLLANRNLSDDVAFCTRCDVFTFAARLDPEGRIKAA